MTAVRETGLSRRACLVAWGGLVSGGACSRAATLKAPPENPIDGRSLVFDDPFTRLDTSVWHAGRKVGSADGGFYGRSAFARISGEEGVIPYAIVKDELAGGGTALQISAKYIGKPMHVPGYYGNDLPEFQWISGNLQAATPDGGVRKGWRRGYFEARMRFPKHPLSWPAFWMLNGRCIRFPQTSVELDIVEHKGFEPFLYGTYLHEHGKPGEHHASSGVPTPVDMTTRYCRYGMLVDEAWCAPYFERKPILQPATGRPLIWEIGRSAELDAHADVFWPILTLALRSDYPYPKPLKIEDQQAHMRVDYVRVYA